MTRLAALFLGICNWRSDVSPVARPAPSESVALVTTSSTGCELVVVLAADGLRTAVHSFGSVAERLNDRVLATGPHSVIR